MLAGGAGCSGESSSGSNYPPEKVGAVEATPESYSLRNPSADPVVWTGERPTPREDEDRRYYRHHTFVTGPDDAAGLSVADVPGVDEARVFLDGTDYDAATVYVERRTVQRCFTLELCHVRWTEDDIDTSYSRRYRDADVACETDAEDTIATLIRIPEAFDPSGISGYGSSYGSGTCEERNARLRRRQNESRKGE
jgi:hypothetical protein